MKEQLSSLELRFLVRELQCLVGGRLDKAYQGEGERKHDLLLQCNTGEGKRLLRFVLPGIACLAAEKPPYPRMPGHFAVFLRRKAANARIISVEQRAFERILEIGLERKEGVFTLLVELLPPGNLLLLKEGLIVGLLQPQRHGQRLLRGGAEYEPPPPCFDTGGADEKAVAERLAASSKESIVKALAADLGLGSLYAEEACARAGLEKEAPITGESAATAAAAVTALLAEGIDARSDGREAYPFPLRTKEGGEPRDSFSAAIEALIPESEEPAAAEPKRRTDVRAQQRAQLEGYRRAAEENQRKGELLYERYQEVERLLAGIEEDRKRMPWRAVKEKYAARAAIDESKGEVTIELEEQ